MNPLSFLLATLLVTGSFLSTNSLQSQPATSPQTLFNPTNLVAWCIVPFDAKQRTPSQRAEMVQRLGLSKVAYDWREQHVPTFEQEILEYQKHHLEFFAFWSTHDAAFDLFQKYNLHPQIWQIMSTPNLDDPQAKVKAAAEALLPLVNKTRQLQCPLGLYNHGGWSGEPDNLVAVVQYLRCHHQAHHVGIVYNLHHGHEHIPRFRESLYLMKPYLLCLNLNGMNTQPEPKILGIGKGQHDQELLQIILDSGYTGPIGILDHRENLDAEESLRENLDGLAQLKFLQ